MNRLISLIAQYAVFVSIAIAIVVWLRLPRQQKWEFAVTGVIGGVIALALLKLGSALYYDPRPFVSQHIAPLFPHAADNGFPSDHTLLAMFLAMCVLFYSSRWGVVLVAVAAAIGVDSRRRTCASPDRHRRRDGLCGDCGPGRASASSLADATLVLASRQRQQQLGRLSVLSLH